MEVRAASAKIAQLTTCELQPAELIDPTLAQCQNDIVPDQADSGRSSEATQR
jgi:hypothetical protein